MEILEGLQVEEEGLPELHKAKQKHDAKIRKEVQSHRRRHQSGRNVQAGRRFLAEDGVRFNSSRKNRRRTKPRAKYPDLEEEFDQVEPKYFPTSDEFNPDPEYYGGENEPSSRKRIQYERRRRIHHAGDTTAVENAEREKSRNASLVGDMIKDDVAVLGRNVGKKRFSSRCRKMLGGCTSQGSKPKEARRKCRGKLPIRGRKFPTVTSEGDKVGRVSRRRGWRKPLRRNSRRR